jgi:hypothetical protein
MIQRRGGPSFSREDEERLLAFMQVTRHLNVYYGAASVFNSPQHGLSEALTGAIDKLGEHITGEPRLFVMDHHSIGGAPERTSPKHVRELLWKELRLKYR